MFRDLIRTFLQILMIGIGALLVARFIRWVATRYRAHVDATTSTTPTTTAPPGATSTSAPPPAT